MRCFVELRQGQRRNGQQQLEVLAVVQGVEEGGDPAEAAGPLAAADIVVNATTVGMGDPGPDDLPLDPAPLHAGQLVVDIVYRPLETPLLAAARRQGATAVNGVPMLVHQAAVAFELWTGVPAPVADMSLSVAELLS